MDKSTAPDDHPVLRVAVVGAGPAGFFCASHLLAESTVDARVDLYERLPTPWGLVRSGVAPDHPTIKAVTRVFEKTAADPRFRFFGHVELGTHVSRTDLLERYDAVVYASGAQHGRRPAVPGADLSGVWSAEEFVGWYNAHPDHSNHRIDLSAKQAVVLGNGNVALDAARILSLPADTLVGTDIADRALAALRASNIREVLVLGRRGPDEASFTSVELRELGQLPGVKVRAEPRELFADEPGPAGADGARARKAELLRGYSCVSRSAADDRVITLRFLRSPIEFVGDTTVEGVRVAINELRAGDDGPIAHPTGAVETVPASLVVCAIGYHGRPVPGLPFDKQRGIIPNIGGKVTGADREYVAGWIKRGPSGVIGTNKQCARESMTTLLADLAERTPLPARPDQDATEAWLATRQPALVTQQAWLSIDAAELSRGAEQDRPRVKFAHTAELLAAANIRHKAGPPA